MHCFSGEQLAAIQIGVACTSIFVGTFLGLSILVLYDKLKRWKYAYQRKGI
jgi:hypothetical protein